VAQPAAIATCKKVNRHTQQVTEAAVMQNRDYSAEGTRGRQNRGWQGGHSSRNTQHPIDRSLLLSAAPNSSASSNHLSINSNSLQDTLDTRSPIKPHVSQYKLKMSILMQWMTTFSLPLQWFSRL
jgi:hypothetical protein